MSTDTVFPRFYSSTYIYKHRRAPSNLDPISEEPSKEVSTAIRSLKIQERDIIEKEKNLVEREEGMPKKEVRSHPIHRTSRYYTLPVWNPTNIHRR